MTTLSLTRLDEIEAAASKADASYWEGLRALIPNHDPQDTARTLPFVTFCDPQTVLTLVRIAKAALLTAKWRQSEPHLELLADELREAGLL